jgi:hypothetical protein
VDVRDAIADILTGLAEALGEYMVKSHSFGLGNDDGSDDGRSDVSSPVSVKSAFSYASSGEGAAEVDVGSGVSTTHYAFFIDMSLKSLLRFSILIRKAGDKLRYKKADDDLARIQIHAPETYTELRAHLETLILIGPSEHSLLTRLDSATARNGIPKNVKIVLRAWIHSRLSPIQNRLVQANIIRRHRIMCSRKDGRHSRPAQPKPASRPTAAVPTERPSSSSALPPHTAMLPTEPNRSEFRPPVIPSPRIIEEASSAQTTTVIGSELSTAAMRSGRASSTVSKLTRTGRNQDYPKASVFDRSPQCPYCGIVLDLGYAKNEKKWQ